MSRSGTSSAGRRRNRKTRRTVLWANRAAGALVTLGGIGTIVAVSTVCVFLVWVVVPLFLSPAIELVEEPPLALGTTPGRLVHFQVDEHLTAGWAYFADGSFALVNLADGTVLSRRRPFGDEAPTCWSFSESDEQCAFGFADGTVRLGRVGFALQLLDAAELPEAPSHVEVGATVRHGEGVLQRTPEGPFRLKTLRIELDEPAAVSAKPVLLVDQSSRPSGSVVASLTADGVLSVNTVRKRENLLTGETVVSLSGGKTSVALDRGGGGRPSRLLLSGLGDNIYLAWDDGRCVRYDASGGDPRVAEELDLVDAPGETLTAAPFLIGKTTLLTGDSQGRVRAWFRIKPEDAATVDRSRLVCAHELPAGRAAVRSLAPSARSRIVAAGFADGTVGVYQVTARQRLGEVNLPAGEAVDVVVLAPREDAVFAASGSRVQRCNLDAPHAGITLGSILAPVWYEGYEKPEHVWQSSSGTDAFEPKLGLWPLVFGTIKATVYSMLFGVPLAILAAIYTSEFLHPRVKSRVKPLVEMMASLPSVVLGFLAALVIAPLVENVVTEVILVAVAIPVAFLASGFLWQLLPRRVAGRWSRFRFVLLLLVVPVAAAVAWPLGRPVERVLFAGDVKAWLDGQIGTGLAAWMFVLLPASALGVAVWIGRVVNPRLRKLARGWSHRRFAWLDFGKFLAGVGLALGLALGISWALSGAGFDPRGSFVDTYVQRNAMIVGFIMGFAVIPITYTIAEDALSAVPDHLRAASLAAGATPWQTAVRIILPTAASGLFSAVMIGLGRAVGETMIVLMAAGNTPILDWNIFNGFRTLSANIAVELPEAVRNSTHYRMLFLAALALFVMTFVLNTVAEMVRLRFRRRAFEL